jgi:precorrin-2 dehydrogenase
MDEFYPVMLRLRGRVCVIVGGGAVGARKAVSLVRAGAAVTVISPTLHPTLQNLVDSAMITAHLIPYAPGVLAGLRPVLVFAATDDSQVNHQVADEAWALGAWVDRADSGADSDFLSMSSFQRGSLTVAVSSGGVSSALAIHLRERLEQAIGSEYAILSQWVEEQKPQVREKIESQSERSRLWKSIVESSILDDLRRGDDAGARALFDRLVTEAIKSP